jgi:RNA methyltransferase, TrmH family
MTITSQHNPALKQLRRLARKHDRERDGRFAAEGEDLVAAAELAGWPALEGYRVAGSGLGGPGFIDVEQAALAAVSTLGSGTRVIGVYEQRFDEAPAGPLCVYLHGVGDPGNVGAVLRSAQAFGASGVALGPGCADPYSPKGVRASMGAIFGVPIARVESIAELPGERIALVAGAGEPLRGLDPGAATASAGESPAEVSDRARGLTLLVGAERDGLPDAVVAACERVAHIPIAAESLNAAMAATVALYEMTRNAAKPGSPNRSAVTETRRGNQPSRVTTE